MTQPSDLNQLNLVKSCLNKILNKDLSEREINLLEGILKTKGNSFKYQEVVKVQYPDIGEEQAQKIANNYKAYFGTLRKNFQDYYDNAPYLEGFEIKVTKANFKRLLDTYIFDNNNSELLDIRISNIFCMVESINQLPIDTKAIKNLESFRTKIKNLIQIFKELLNKIK